MAESESEKENPPPEQPAEDSPFPEPTMDEVGKSYDPPGKETRDD